MDGRKLTIHELKEQMRHLDELNVPDTAVIMNAMVLSAEDKLVNEWMVSPGTMVMEVEYPTADHSAVMHAYLRFQPPIVFRTLS